ncbi:hypothetical protein QJQ45_022126 [Haematococcus lacustris]|nr:hypothetical protein QJQ45_022126 [Haematococcus lacustris]
MWCPVVAPRKPPQPPRSSQAATQPAASEPGPSTPPPAKRSKRTKAVKSKPAPQPSRHGSDTALNMQRIGESRWRPLELCYWPEQGALPAKGKEYPGLGYKRLRDKPPKAQEQQPAAAHSRADVRMRVAESSSLTDNDILSLSGESAIEDVRELTLRGFKLSSFKEHAVKLTGLTALSLSHNQLTSLASFSLLTSLSTLNVNANLLTSLRGIEGCTSLRQLYACSNRLHDLLPLLSLQRLETLAVFGNVIASLDAALQVLASLPCLADVSLGGNPASTVPGYRQQLVLQLPALQVLDGEPVTALDWELAHAAWAAQQPPPSLGEAGAGSSPLGSGLGSDGPKKATGTAQVLVVCHAGEGQEGAGAPAAIPVLRAAGDVDTAAGGGRAGGRAVEEGEQQAAGGSLAGGAAAATAAQQSSKPGLCQGDEQCSTLLLAPTPPLPAAFPAQSVQAAGPYLNTATAPGQKGWGAGQGGWGPGQGGARPWTSGPVRPTSSGWSSSSSSMGGVGLGLGPAPPRPGTASGFTCRLLSDQLLNDNPVLLEYLAQAVLAEGQVAVQARPRSSGPLGSSSDVGVGAASGSLVRRLRATASACSATQDLHPAELAAGQALQAAIQSAVAADNDAVNSSDPHCPPRLTPSAAHAASLLSGATPEELVRQLVRLAELLLRELNHARQQLAAAKGGLAANSAKQEGRVGPGRGVGGRVTAWGVGGPSDGSRAQGEDTVLGQRAGTQTAGPLVAGSASPAAVARPPTSTPPRQGQGVQQQQQQEAQQQQQQQEAQQQQQQLSTQSNTTVRSNAASSVMGQGSTAAVSSGTSERQLPSSGYFSEAVPVDSAGSAGKGDASSAPTPGDEALLSEVARLRKQVQELTAENRNVYWLADECKRLRAELAKASNPSNNAG